MAYKSINVGVTWLRRGFKHQVVSLTLSCLSLCSGGLAAEPYKEIGQPGEPINLQQYIVAGLFTVFDFGSKYCPPCRASDVQFRLLAKKYPGHYAFRRININRPGVVGIDWNSPLARQYGLRSIPHLTVFGPDRRLLADGDAAEKWLANDIRNWQKYRWLFQ